MQRIAAFAQTPTARLALRQGVLCPLIPLQGASPLVADFLLYWVNVS